MTKREILSVLAYAKKEAMNIFNVTGNKSEEVCGLIFEHLYNALEAQPVLHYRTDESDTEEPEEDEED